MSISKEQYLTKREIRNFIYFLSYFFWLVFSYSLFTAFYLPLFLSIIALFAGTAVFTYNVLYWLRPARPIFYSFILSLLVSQSVWFLSAIPVNHWTAAALLLLVYFMIWDIVKLKLQEALTWRLVLRDVIFGAVGVMLILVSSRIII